MTSMLSSWVDYDSATCHFPIQNLPYGVFKTNTTSSTEPHCCTAIGDFIVDLFVLSKAKVLPVDIIGETVEAPTWNLFMALGPTAWAALRTCLTDLFASHNTTLKDNTQLRQECMIPRATSSVQLLLPATIGDYTDFYSSKEHATNLGRMFRPDGEPLLPNWVWMPVAYHGRASSITVSGTPIRRPWGQSRMDSTAPPIFSPSKRIDMEIEVAAWVGASNTLGTTIPVAEAVSNHIFGLSVFNDWSARDIQPWEYVPLGPFLAKNFASTISPWIVSMAALEPFFVASPVQDPSPLSYLTMSAEHAARAAVDIKLTAELIVSNNNKENTTVTLSETNYKHMYWTLAQQVAHHTVNGCNLRPGDVLASGTISGTEKSSWGSLIEITNRGQNPIVLPSGEKRTFAEDGDVIRISAVCEGNGFRIGFGEAEAVVLPALENPLQ